MIELREVTKRYHNKTVVDHVSFSVQSGECLGLLGPNGAGKTTTIRMILGLLTPTTGEIYVNGLDVSRSNKQAQALIGAVFEQPNLYIRSTIRSNLKLFADLYGIPETRINQVMEELQLIEKQHMKVGTLSKGWKQRVLIARAILHEPRVLFLDEPTSGLDPNTTALIHGLIRRLKRSGTTILLTTHDMAEADELSCRVGIMYNGRLAAIDTPDKLKSIHASREMEIHYTEGNQRHSIRLPMGLEESNRRVAQLMLDGGVTSIRSTEGTLAEVFAAVTGRELS